MMMKPLPDHDDAAIVSGYASPCPPEANRLRDHLWAPSFAAEKKRKPWKRLPLASLCILVPSIFS